ncbi:hypothetical protein AB0J34_33925 [Nonomuraea dietziae]
MLFIKGIGVEFVGREQNRTAVKCCNSLSTWVPHGARIEDLGGEGVDGVDGYCFATSPAAARPPRSAGP